MLDILFKNWKKREPNDFLFENTEKRICMTDVTEKDEEN